MKKLLTVSLVLLFASGASAQILSNGVLYNNGVQGGINGANIVYNVSPLPPILSNNHVIYPSGTAMVANGGGAVACNSPLTIDPVNGTQQITCHNPVVRQNDASSATTLANLAPAAGGPRALSDRNLTSDSNASLRNDYAVIGIQ
jgi:hypothetical protein